MVFHYCATHAIQQDPIHCAKSCRVVRLRPIWQDCDNRTRHVIDGSVAAAIVGECAACHGDGRRLVALLPEKPCDRCEDGWRIIGQKAVENHRGEMELEDQEERCPSCVDGWQLDALIAEWELLSGVMAAVVPLGQEERT